MDFVEGDVAVTPHLAPVAVIIHINIILIIIIIVITFEECKCSSFFAAKC